MRKLRCAFDLLGVPMGTLEIPDPEAGFPISPSLAHWAIWYGHWGVCEWLESVGCFPANSRPRGNGSMFWTAGRTPMEYARYLDSKSRHGWYRIGESLQSALTRGRERRAAAPATPDGGNGGVAAAAPPDIDEVWQEVEAVNVTRIRTPQLPAAVCSIGACELENAPLFSLSCQCKHTYCGHCITQHLTERLRAGPFPVHCPDCLPASNDSLITRSVLKGLVNANALTDTIARRVFQQQQMNVDDEVSIDLLLRSSKRCPNCRTPISHYKKHGCHHIRGCPSCHHHFCYICLYDSGLVWDGCPNRCPIYCVENCGCTLCPDCSPGHPCGNCEGHGGGAHGCPVCNVNV